MAVSVVWCGGAALTLGGACPTKGCQAIKSIREGSFFGRSHLGLDVIVELMYFWSKKVRSSLLQFIMHNNRGRAVDGHWVFGGIERGTTKSFMVVVEDRSAATLIPIIQQYIWPGSVIISDEWRAYSTLSSLGYTHQTVNHSRNFVDPGTGAHTNSIEGYWSVVKRQMRRQGVMNTTNDLFPTYLLESLWRKRFCGEEFFEKLLSCISEQYPL